MTPESIQTLNIIPFNVLGHMYRNFVFSWFRPIFNYSNINEWYLPCKPMRSIWTLKFNNNALMAILALE